MLFWVERRLCVERELACDDGVLRQTGAAKAYATCLARVAEHSLFGRRAALALGALGARTRRPELSRRIQRLLDAKSIPAATRFGSAFASMLIAGVVGGAALLQHAPQLISFAPSPSASAAMSASPVSATAAPYRAVQVKAVLPVKAAPALLRCASRRTPHPRAMHSARAPFQPTLVSWQADAQLVSTPAVYKPQQVHPYAAVATYAAVPVGNGWLLIRL